MSREVTFDLKGTHVSTCNRRYFRTYPATSIEGHNRYCCRHLCHSLVLACLLTVAQCWYSMACIPMECRRLQMHHLHSHSLPDDHHQPLRSLSLAWSSCLEPEGSHGLLQPSLRGLQGCVVSLAWQMWRQSLCLQHSDD